MVGEGRSSGKGGSNLKRFPRRVEAPGQMHVSARFENLNFSTLTTTSVSTLRKGATRLIVSSWEAGDGVACRGGC